MLGPELVAQGSVGHERSGSWHPRFPWVLAGWQTSCQANCISSLSPATISPCQPGKRVCGFPRRVSQEDQKFPSLSYLSGVVTARDDAWRKKVMQKCGGIVPTPALQVFWLRGEGICLVDPPLASSLQT